MSKAIQTAELTWQCIDGIEIPISTQFGDIYFSKDNGLLESRHVYLEGNDLSTRLSELKAFEYFCVGELGFGTGLNVLALWQMWQTIRPNNQSHLHVVSFEKHPFTKQDFIRSLQAWPELAPLAEQLIRQYPAPISGGHRLQFSHERFSLDLWFGDALENLEQIPKQHPVNAWFLDGFSPALNPELWQENILTELVRLSEVGTTFSSFSVAGHLRRGLKQLGLNTSRPKGFAHKKEMLKAIFPMPEATPSETQANLNPIKNRSKAEIDFENLELTQKTKTQQRQIAIIGAGIAGLSSAYALALRGHSVTIYDQSEPISGASGNPLALLNPRLNPIEKIDDHLMTVAWKFALSHYPKFKAFQPLAVNQFVLKNPEESVQLSQAYPNGIFNYKNIERIHSDQHLHTAFDALCFETAGTVQPEMFKNEVLAHPLIEFKKLAIDRIEQIQAKIHLYSHQQPNPQSSHQLIQTVDHVIVCCALNSPQFFDYYPALKPNRGQVSWMNYADADFNSSLAHSYGGYCAQLNTKQLILGASFFPHRADDEVLLEDHQHNFDLFQLVFPQQAERLPPMHQWQGRASVRAQSLDYFPLVGQLDIASEIYTLSGLGSKGYLYAPLCAEILASNILNEFSPVSTAILKKINPRRFIKKVKPKKPYYQKPNVE